MIAKFNYRVGRERIRMNKGMRIEKKPHLL